MAYSIAQLNDMSQIEFVGTLGAVFENTPAIAHHTWYQRPFTNLTDLHQAMLQVVSHLSKTEQLALIRAHPDLGSKTKMADASVQEQAGAGLNWLTPGEYGRFQALNQAYKEKFNFPFILAVRNHTKTSILEAFEQRLQHSGEVEIQQALTEIAKIAEFRLLDLIES
jgi:2-oxo-4-hydroxy-4-carboxy-5-ureidoimidazoline decarboxylase